MNFCSFIKIPFYLPLLKQSLHLFCFTNNTLLLLTEELNFSLLGTEIIGINSHVTTPDLISLAGN